ncbi:MAG: hypothetical protein SPJ13_02575 [Bacteroidales bacterium]|nr:hypothetical protein [Bacteroidales bacterium]
MKKNVTLKSLCFLFALASASITVQAQGLNQSLFLNFGFPTGQFHDKALPTGSYLLTKDYIGTNATAGIGIGYRASYRFDVGFGDVDGFLDANLFWNRVRGDVREDIITNNGKSSYYFNIPILLGVQYSYPLTEVFRPYAEFGVGYDMFKVAAEGWKEDNPAQNKFYAKYNVGGAFAFELGAGCYFGEHVSASLHFYGLGQHTINYNANKTSPELYTPHPLVDNNGNPLFDPSGNPLMSNENNNNVMRRANVLALRIGFHF